jgi:2-oxoglutarate ferredoxin oxidoreductase subunit alpha
VRFCSFYPMTPSTSIPLTLAAHASRLGIVVEQAEDEIAAINMALGASYAGAPAVVATSGGGLALMVEGVSLAGMIETPIVVVVSQRPGPATGLPTRTEQGDLELVLHAGHGEFPRAIFAPGTVEECFHLTRKAFEASEKAQSPAFVLTDQFLADSYRAVEPFEVEALPPVAVPAVAEPAAHPYARFAITDEGVSPRLLPGRSEHLVVVDSDEHTEDGHITEDLGVRIQMVDKRLRKQAVLEDQTVGPTIGGDERPEVLLVSWGSTRGSVEEAAARARGDGRTVGTVHFGQVWPLVPEEFMPAFESAGTVVCVEGNATGQFARLIRRETGFECEAQVLRYDGLPITPEYVSRSLASAGVW